MKTPEERLREANALLYEVSQTGGVIPPVLRRLAATFVQESHWEAVQRLRVAETSTAQLDRRNAGARACSFCPNNHGVFKCFVRGNGNIYACALCLQTHASILEDDPL